MDLELRGLGFKFISWHLWQGRRPSLHLQNGAFHRLCNRGPQPFEGEGSSRTPCPQHMDYVSTFSMCSLRKFTLTKATINSVQLFDESVLFVTTASAQIRDTFTHICVRCV